MIKNVLEELSRQEIPPPPVDLPHEVHRRLNERLLFWQLAELVFCGIPYALVLFSKAMFSAVYFSLQSKNSSDPNSKGPQS